MGHTITDIRSQLSASEVIPNIRVINVTIELTINTKLRYMCKLRHLGWVGFFVVHHGLGWVGSET